MSNTCDERGWRKGLLVLGFEIEDGLGVFLDEFSSHFLVLLRLSRVLVQEHHRLSDARLLQDALKSNYRHFLYRIFLFTSFANLNPNKLQLGFKFATLLFIIQLLASYSFEPAEGPEDLEHGGADLECGQTLIRQRGQPL